MLQAEHALREAMALRHAAEWSNIDDVLGTQNQLVPTLQEQCSQARRQLQACDDHVLSSDTRWDEASTFRQAAEGTLHGAVELRARLHAELQSLAVSRDASSDPTAELAAIGVQLSELDIALRDALTQAATLAERHTAMQQRQADAASRHDQAIVDAAQATAAWHALSQQIANDGLAFPAVTSADAATLAATAQSKRAVLLDRVARANGASDLVDAIRRDEVNPIDAWHRTRHWLARRVPAQVADHSDPLRALVRLRDQLSMLHARLVRQEGDLRGASEDVARGIDVQLRRAAGTIKRLNQQLDGIGFGSIGAIRVQMRRIEKMEQILRALRAGEAQELLFLPTMPIEEALDEIFRRYGGAGKSGGQRLLDYREYLELVVEIKRQANPEWEIASPSRLSTGEAIGVGAALMMVVLAEWERDANLLRARPAGGSLRFLFLDEANRLSRDNLGVLFDLCRTLEMQLLIAAPEVARAQGNTTYRLVRHIADDGREEVIVSGRRAMLQTEAEPEPEILTEMAENPLAAPTNTAETH
nr:chromosome partition protein MukB [Kofleriaceae bacterium]